jgi:hypothetical protein
MAVASADVRRSRSRFSTRRVSRLHSSPARDGVTVQGRACVYCQGGAQCLWRGQKCRAGCQNRPLLPEIRNRADGHLGALLRSGERFGDLRRPAKCGESDAPRACRNSHGTCSGALRWGLFPCALAPPRPGSALSPSPSGSRPRLASGLLPRRPVLVAGVPASGVVSFRLEAVTEASVEGQRGVSQMTEHQPQAARLSRGSWRWWSTGLGRRRWRCWRRGRARRRAAWWSGVVAAARRGLRARLDRRGGRAPRLGRPAPRRGPVWRPWARERRASDRPIEDCARRRLRLRRPALTSEDARLAAEVRVADLVE